MMLLELCVVLRMVINDHNLLSLDSYDIVPCEASGEVENDLKEKSGSSPPSVADGDTKPGLDALWNHNPIIRWPPPQVDVGSEWMRQETFRQPHSLTKLSKTIQKDFNPFFRKSDFEFERRTKPIKLVAIRKNGIAQKKATYKASTETKTGEVAELQSPYNDVGTFWKEFMNT